MKQATALLGGAAFGLALATGLFSLTGASSVTEGGTSWPPAPENIVNWVAENHLPFQGGSPSITIPQGQDRAIYTVPFEWSLVLTEASTLVPNNSVIVERRPDGIEIIKLPVPLDYESNSAVGLVFGPGSEIVLRHTTTQHIYFPRVARFTGYLSR